MCIGYIEISFYPSQPCAYLTVHSCAFFSACFLFDFHSDAASLFNGSSGLGSDNKLWIERSTDLICKAGDQFFFKISKQILPKLSALWLIYQYWDDRFWYQRQLWALSLGNLQEVTLLLWTFLLRSMCLGGLSFESSSTFNDDEKVSKIIRIRRANDARYGVRLKSLCLFDNSWAWAFHFVDFDLIENYK